MNPFEWKKDPRPSVILQDPAFKPKGAVVSTDYKLFGIYSRAKPNIKPTLNKHELPKGRL